MPKQINKMPKVVIEEVIPACVDCSSTEIKIYKADDCEHYYHICDICYIKYKYAIQLAPKPV